MKKYSSKLTQSVHTGSVGDPVYGGLVNPIYPSSAYDYDKEILYPRYFNTPNQKAVVEKIAALENTEDGLLFSSGMAAIMTSMFALLKQGDHILFQNDLYGGTHHAAITELGRYGIQYSMVDVVDLKKFEGAILNNTKVIFIETPSNPLLRITDIAAVAKIARKHKIITNIDNTFASTVNQNPIDLGIDIVTHSGTKYIGGYIRVGYWVGVHPEKKKNKKNVCTRRLVLRVDGRNAYLDDRHLETLASIAPHPTQKAPP